MKKTTMLAMAAAVVLAAGAAHADYARGDFNGWGTGAPLQQTGNFWSTTVVASATAPAGGLKFDLDGNWGSTAWGAGTSATVNGSIGTARNDGSGNLSMPATVNKYYTFHLAGTYNWGERAYVVMETTYQPVTFLSVTDDSATQGMSNVTVMASCMAGYATQISPEEDLYAMYTTDGWSTRHLVKATKTGLVGRMAIPGQPGGTTVEYFVFSSTMPTNLFTDAPVYSSPANLDQLGFCMLSSANGGATRSYTVVPTERVAGNAWHCPTNLEPWASATMRDPATVCEGDTPFLRLGGYPKSGTEAITSGQLKYKAGSGNWTTRNLRQENTDASAYPENAYWTNSLPADKMTEGTLVQYYFVATYSNSATLATTYVGTLDGVPSTTWTNEALAKSNAFTFTVGAAPVVPADLGNAWHVPTNAEPAGAYMRNPRHPYANQAVSVYNGNQDGGSGGTLGNQTGGTVWYRSGNGAWSSAAMSFDVAQGNNKYWRGEIPANAFAALATVEYVIEVRYSDHDTTYLGMADGSSVASGTYATLAEAQARAFDFTYGGTPGSEPGFLWHGGNAVKLGGDTVELWVKIGYKDGANAWADEAEIRYAVKETAAPGARGVRRVAKGARSADATLTNTVAMRLDHTEWDGGGNGEAMWWVGTVKDAALAASPNAVLEYQIAARRTTAGGGNGVWRLAEYQSDGMNDQVYQYRMVGTGAGGLTVNGQNADYTTSKFFIDEAAGETAHLRVVYAPPAGAQDVQLYSNVGRRDFWNADLDGDGVADAIRPPSGNLYTASTTNGYYRAWPMTWDAAAGGYVWEADVGQCGAYRLTARYRAAGSTNWSYYSELGSGVRDHAVVISPKKVLRQTVYEVNGLTAKATSATENGRSTFADLIDGSDSFDEFGIEYLNKIQANCLWFQPIHTSSGYGLAPGGEPGSPYAAKDYFAVSKWFGRDGTSAGALAEFQRFVAACDAGKTTNMAASHVGTINIMLDGVFNHTSWDAVFGEMGERMGLVPQGAGASTAIASVKPGWYANCSDYGAPATWYTGPAGGQHDIACAPDRGDFGKWGDTAELFYGAYSALVRHNPDNNGDYLNEDDQYDYTSMTADTVKLWEYMGSYVPFWLEKTGHPGSNTWGEVNADGVVKDDLGIDGLRCDFGQGLPPQFWEYCINRARSVKWNFMFMAESLDGGKVSYRSNRHFDILNESFVFSMVNAGSPADVKNAVEGRKSAYNGGAVLLNLTSHDEVMPYSDPWVTASRYAMVSSVQGLPMCFYGQEQGITPCTADKSGKGEGASVDGDASSGFAKFELNFGKWVANFKNWNKLTVWENPPDVGWSRHMAQWYGRVNWARLNDAALRGGNTYYLGRKGAGTYDNGRIFAVAKAEDDANEASGKDAVLAFTLFVNPGDHSGMTETYDLSACAGMIGLQNSATAFYNVRNLASSNAESFVWATPKSGAELTSDGITVVFLSDGTGNIYDDGHIVQYLKLEKVGLVPTLTLDSATEDGFAASWTACTDASGYVFEVSTTADFATTVVQRNVSGTSTAVTGLSADTVYYARVKGAGTWSETASIRTAAAAPVSGYAGWLAEMGLTEADCPAAGVASNGMSNWSCYVADLDPRGAEALELEALGLDAAGVRYTFPASADRYYVLEEYTNLLTAPTVRVIGWGVPGMIVTNATGDLWFGRLKVYLEAP